MKAILFILLLSQSIYAASTGTIIQISRKMRMSYLEPLPPKEYFIDLGERDGLKVGDTVDVYRMIPVTNGLSGGPWHLLKANIGELRLQFVGESSSLGRMDNEREPSALPVMEFQTLMMGDQVEMRMPSVASGGQKTASAKTSLPFR